MSEKTPNIAFSRGNASFPLWHQNYIPTAQEWLNCFSNKADADDLDAFKKIIFSHEYPDENAIKNLYDRLLSLEKNEKELSQAFSALFVSSSIPVTIIGTTLDTVKSDFEAREQASLSAKLTTQLAWMSQQQQQARFTQKMILREKQKGLYP